MKQNRKNKVKIVASKIQKLESQLALDKNNKSIQDEIEKIMLTLNLEEMIQVDNIIMKNKKS